MFNKELFIKYHWKQSLLAAIVIISSISFSIIIEDTDWLLKNVGLVKGESVAPDGLLAGDKNYQNVVIRYQSKLKNIIGSYLTARAQFDGASQEWLFLLNNTKHQLLGLEVPVAYHDLQLKLLGAFDFEKELVTQGAEDRLNLANEKWQNILLQYYWLE